MKYLLLSTLLIFTGIGVCQDEIPIDNGDFYLVEELEKDDYDPDFETVFSTDEDLENFKKLRMYLQKKQKLQQTLKSMLSNFSQSDTSAINSSLHYAQSMIELGGEGPMSKFHVSIKTESEPEIYDAKETLIDADYIRTIVIPALNAAKIRTTAILNANETIKKNISLISEDIEACQDQIDATLAPEYKDQKFRAEISFYFTIMIGVLLLGFFMIIAFKSDKNIGREFLGESGLQFVTMFVLIIAVILFGILGILEAKELTAILSGVSGYILGKGASNISKKGDTESTETTDPPATYDEITSPPATPDPDYSYDPSSNESGAVG